VLHTYLREAFCCKGDAFHGRNINNIKLEKKFNTFMIKTLFNVKNISNVNGGSIRWFRIRQWQKIRYEQGPKTASDSVEMVFRHDGNVRTRK